MAGVADAEEGFDAFKGGIIILARFPQLRTCLALSALIAAKKLGGAFTAFITFLIQAFAGGAIAAGAIKGRFAWLIIAIAMLAQLAQGLTGVVAEVSIGALSLFVAARFPGRPWIAYVLSP